MDFLQYILPAIVHIRHQAPLQFGDGCIVRICACDTVMSVLELRFVYLLALF